MMFLYFYTVISFLTLSNSLKFTLFITGISQRRNKHCAAKLISSLRSSARSFSTGWALLRQTFSDQLTTDCTRVCETFMLRASLPSLSLSSLTCNSVREQIYYRQKHLFCHTLWGHYRQISVFADRQGGCDAQGRLCTQLVCG